MNYVFGAFAQTLHYLKVPRYFTWTQPRMWMPRQQDTLVDICPGLFKSIKFYQGLLSVNVTGPFSFADIQT